MPTIWINGRLCDAREASISPFDHGLLTGDGAFETLVSYGGRAFAFRRHYQRLQRSSGALGIGIPGESTLRAAISSVLAANSLGDGRIRITVTGGEAPLGSEKGNAVPTAIVAATEKPDWPGTARVVTVPYSRNEKSALAGLKTTSYGENVVALAFARARGAHEAIFPNTQGQLCEGTGSNIFLVKDGMAITPPLSSGCLGGVTRALVLELCQAEGIPCEERHLPIGDLSAVGEAFLTSTTREVQPIGSIDGRELPGAPGETTARLRSAFKRLVASEIDP